VGVGQGLGGRDQEKEGGKTHVGFKNPNLEREKGTKTLHSQSEVPLTGGTTSRGEKQGKPGQIVVLTAKEARARPKKQVVPSKFDAQGGVRK